MLFATALMVFIMFKYLKKIRKSNYVVLGISMITYFGNVMFTTFDIPAKITGIQNYDENKFCEYK